jgi:hypothetical protein
MPESTSLRTRLTKFRPERLQGFSQSQPDRISPQQLAERLNGEWISDGLIKITEEVALKNVLNRIPNTGHISAPVLPGEINPLPGLYIDTETTGLAGGSGTLAFLVGVATVESRKIHLTQYLITSFSAEQAMLAELKRVINTHHRLISYNGKSYDAPLLLTRFRMHGIHSDIERLDHLDLLHLVRRLFSSRWENCRLTTAENNLLDFFRENDLPGSEAPEAWFSFIRSGSGEALIKVVSHNRQDILTLPAIHYALTQAIENPLRYKVSLYGLARWMADIDEPSALQVLQQHSNDLCKDSKRLLASLYRRQKQWGNAVALWEDLAKNGCHDSIMSLAKYHEHISKMLDVAISYCQQLPASKHNLHRQARIQSKIIRSPQ